MKKYLSFAVFSMLMAASVFALASCGGDDDDDGDDPQEQAEENGSDEDNNDEDESKPKPLTPAGQAAVAVDLGLPSGTLWADRNVGADKAEEPGDYFAWGETAPKNRYNLDISYKWFTEEDRFTKYKGSDDDRYVLELKDDAANANWGGSWRMPTREELLELLSYTNIQFVKDYNNTDIDGYKFISKSNPSKFIFLPVTGYKDGTSHIMPDYYGEYWTSSLSTEHVSVADMLFFTRDDAPAKQWHNRVSGLSVRPVQQASE
ncbi:MAG: hypothetical protein IJ786_04890 [Bacteroidaceae bacterium]|nr:hypothetical protein [Bacteroidaceae bacterium]